MCPDVENEAFHVGIDYTLQLDSCCSNSWIRNLWPLDGIGRFAHYDTQQMKPDDDKLRNTLDMVLMSLNCEQEAIVPFVFGIVATNLCDI